MPMQMKLLTANRTVRLAFANRDVIGVFQSFMGALHNPQGAVTLTSSRAQVQSIWVDRDVIIAWAIRVDRWSIAAPITHTCSDLGNQAHEQPVKSPMMRDGVSCLLRCVATGQLWNFSAFS